MVTRARAVQETSGSLGVSPVPPQSRSSLQVSPGASLELSEHSLSWALGHWCPSPAGVSHAGARQPGKSPGFSVNWVTGSAELEVINATTGKRSCGGPSRLCKHMFFTRWAKLHGKVGLGHREPCHQLSCSTGTGRDEDIKELFC